MIPIQISVGSSVFSIFNMTLNYKPYSLHRSVTVTVSHAQFLHEVFSFTNNCQCSVLKKNCDVRFLIVNVATKGECRALRQYNWKIQINMTSLQSDYRNKTTITYSRNQKQCPSWWSMQCIKTKWDEQVDHRPLEHLVSWQYSVWLGPW